MKPASAVAIYLLFWFVTLFAVLPFGVRTTREEGREPLPGEADSAPADPMMVRKLMWTTLVSAGLFALFLLNFHFGWLTLGDFPGMSPGGGQR